MVDNNDSLGSEEAKLAPDSPENQKFKPEYLRLIEESSPVTEPKKQFSGTQVRIQVQQN